MYEPVAGRIETFLYSLSDQVVRVQGRQFTFAAGEAMQVEYSHKYTDAGFAELAERAGLEVRRSWNDPRDWFGLRLLQRV